jgi:tetratricopeptide (TPR) repeat protein
MAIMEIRPMCLLRKLILPALLLVVCNSYANNIPGYPDSVEALDPRDVAILPRYCKSTQLFRDEFHPNQSEIAHWYEVMGPAFHAMHHYCWALMETNRAMLLARSKRVRDFYLDSAVGNIDYVIRNSPPDFVMLPEILTKKGENLLRLDRTALGIAALQQAIRLKADYWPPYAALSFHFQKTGNIAQAREWLEKGLAAAPNTRALEKRLKELEGVKQKRED